MSQETHDAAAGGNAVLGNIVDSYTQLYCVIGDPVRHSRSPLMMNRAFRAMEENAVYFAAHIVPEQLPAFIDSVRTLNIRGVNVTIPHKQPVMPLLDKLDASARAVGAVNTIVNEGGVLTGYNTDGIGYVRSLKEEAIANLGGKHIVLLGAGGAARGLIYALAGEAPASIIVANRRLERAEQLVEECASAGATVRLSAAGADALQHVCEEADIIINTTPAGMHPNVEEMPLGISTAWLKQAPIVSDIVYNPLQTRFLQEARAAGCTVHAGLGMFIYQGAFAFEYWTGRPAPVAEMRDVVLASLSG